MAEMLHQPPSGPPIQRRRLRLGPASVAFLLILSALGLVARTAIQDQPCTHTPEDVAPVDRGYLSGIQVRSPARSLQEILTHPDLIPTHEHPLLGRRAPDFELGDPEGKTWNLRELLADGPVVLVFYHSSCKLCVRQLFDDTEDLPLFRAVGARLVAISADSPESMRHRLEQYGPFGFPVLWDSGNKVAQAYQVFRRVQDGKMADRLLHGTFLIDRHGTIRWVNVGDAPFRRNAAMLYHLAKTEGRLPSDQPGP